VATEFNVDLPPKFIYDKGKPVEDTLEKLTDYLEKVSIAVEEVVKKLFLRVAETADSPTDGHLPTLNEDGGIEDSGVVVDTDTTLAGNSDTSVPTEKAIKTYVDAADVTVTAAVLAAALTAAKGEDMWETDGGDAELKTTDDIDIQNMQLKGMCVENRTDDTGCTQTGRFWFRTDL